MVSPCRASGIDPPTTKSNSEPAPATTRISEKNSGGTLGIDPCLIIWIPFLFWWGKSWLTAGPCSLLPIGYSRTVPRVPGPLVTWRGTADSATRDACSPHRPVPGSDPDGRQYTCPSRASFRCCLRPVLIRRRRIRTLGFAGSGLPVYEILRYAR